jgi:hypothetical protein
LGYLESLSIPPALLIAFVWFAFVPTTFEYSDAGLTIRMPLRTQRTIGWEALKYYWYGRSVFCLEFDELATFQIFVQAFPKSEWKRFTAFLQSRFPDRKATGWIGSRGFKIGRKQ